MNKGQVTDLKKNQTGLAALLIVVVISMVIMLMASGSLWFGLGELEQGYSSRKTEEVRILSDGCVEETLRRIRHDNAYGLGSGEINLALGDGLCILTVAGAGSQRTVVVTGQVDNYYKKLQVDATLTNDYISLDSWQEIE